MIKATYQMIFVDGTEDYEGDPIQATTLSDAVLEVLQEWTEGPTARWRNSNKDFQVKERTENRAVIVGSLLVEVDDDEFESALMKITLDA